ncbi:MAG: FAD:protein FMN transferase, partial [Oscillospiraceae bacterium]
MKKAYFLTKMIISVTIILISSGCTANNATEYSGFFMDSYAQFKVWNGQAKELSQTAEDLDALFSMYNENSDIYKINTNANAVIVHDDTIAIINDTIKLNDEFGGGVDITVGGLTLLWNITSEKPEIPAKEEIDSALLQTGIDKIEIDSTKNTVISQGTRLDLGAVAKGYACDKIKKQLNETDARCAVVTFGSSSLLYGEKPDGQPFRVAIKDPEESGGIIGTFEADACFVSTSGGYERFFEIGGVKYQHILDINTGYPAQTDLISVTVICDGGLKSDFLSTLIFIGGSKELDAHL